MIDHPEAFQLILGPDKRNPCFCLYTDAAEKELHVYYGLELLEVVPKDRHSPAYRLLGARLHNAGLRVRTLEAVFGLDRKTLRTWGLALRSGDRKWLAEVLRGRWGRRKLTLEMESYVRFRWPALQAEGRRDYRKQLQAELLRVFGVQLSGETLRPLLGQLRAGSGAGKASVKVEPAGAESPPVVPREPRMVQGQSEVGEGRKLSKRTCRSRFCPDAARDGNGGRTGIGSGAERGGGGGPPGRSVWGCGFQPMPAAARRASLSGSECNERIGGRIWRSPSSRSFSFAHLGQDTSSARGRVGERTGSSAE
jgi:hypothetical protein